MNQPLRVNRLIVQEQKAVMMAGVSVITLGTVLRVLPISGGDFPVNDGGMFYQMTEDLLQSSFSLPEFTTYNDQSIPYTYPPLAFYVAGFLAATGVSRLTDLLRLLPTAFSVAALVAFGQLAFTVLLNRRSAMGAFLAFALLPESYRWFVMGGGLTRSLGFVLMILALTHIFLLLKTSSRRHLVLAVTFSALAVLSHPQQGWFLAYSIIVLWMTRYRDWRHLKDILMVTTGVVVVTAPWWFTVVARHGYEPFMYATQHGWPFYAGFLNLLTTGGTAEPFVPVLAFLAIVGGLICVQRKDWWLPTWVLVTFLLDSWLPASPASIPLALLAGVCVGELLLPSTNHHVKKQKSQNPSVQARHNYPYWRRGTILLSLIAIYSFFATGVSAGLSLQALARSEREAMQWAARSTPTTAQFLVIAPERWGEDRSSEWFPVLAQRTSVATVQGLEWLGEDRFLRAVQAHETLRVCVTRGSDCVEQWITALNPQVTHVYVPKRATTRTAILRLDRGQYQDDCCQMLRNSLKSDVRYQLLYDGPGAAIYARHAAATGRR